MGSKGQKEQTITLEPSMRALSRAENGLYFPHPTSVLGLEPRAQHMLGKCSASELQPPTLSHPTALRFSFSCFILLYSLSPPLTKHKRFTHFLVYDGPSKECKPHKGREFLSVFSIPAPGAQKRLAKEWKYWVGRRLKDERGAASPDNSSKSPGKELESKS